MFFSVPSASLALRISPANDKVACWMLFPPVSYTRVTYSSELSCFFNCFDNYITVVGSNEREFFTQCSFMLVGLEGLQALVHEFCLLYGTRVI